MTQFSLSPVAPAVEAQNLPKQIQFRFNGVDLGGPDATVIDFVGTSLTAIRGTGVDADKITITLT